MDLREVGALLVSGDRTDLVDIVGLPFACYEMEKGMCLTALDEMEKRLSFARKHLKCSLLLDW